MPTEVRQIIFTSEELYNALKIFRERRRNPMPDAPVDRVAVLADPDIRTVILFGPDDSGVRPESVEISSDEMATSLILYCIDHKIPLPVTASKHLQVFGGSVGLVIHKSADTSASANPIL